MTTLTSSPQEATTGHLDPEEVPPELRPYLPQRPKCTARKRALVSVGFDRRNKCPVTVTWLPPGTRSDSPDARELRNEAIETKRLPCTPEVVHFIDTLHEEGGRPTGTVAIITKRFNGGTLASLVRQLHAPLHPFQVFSLGLQLAELISKTHAAGRIIADLSLETICVDKVSHDYLCGSKLAIVDAEFVNPDEHHSAAEFGLCACMSPQQRAGADLTASDNVYVFGEIVHCLLTWCPGEEAPTRLAGTAPELKCELEGGPHGVPLEYSDVINACLDPDPSRRPQSMAEVVHQLKGVMVSPLLR